MRREIRRRRRGRVVIQIRAIKRNIRILRRSVVKNNSYHQKNNNNNKKKNNNNINNNSETNISNTNI